MKPAINRLGQRFDRLLVIERAGSYVSPGGVSSSRWRCRCDCGAEVLVTARSLVSGNTKSCGCRRVSVTTARNHNGRTKTPGYHAMHHRLRRELGPASTRLCADCSEPASQWSYGHGDPNELIDVTVVGRRGSPSGAVYSIEPDHYQPRCIPCHTSLDRKHPTALRGVAS